MWSRVVMNRETGRWIEELVPGKLRVLEISGQGWSRKGFKEYRSVNYPEFDICNDVLCEPFDLIIAEQVFEHVLWPYRAGRNVLGMLRPGGYFLITVPFLVRIHGSPADCTRWPETGLKYFLAECGFPLNDVKTGSWGNRRCIEANYREWTNFYRHLNSLENEPDFPFHVWALARNASV
jgi:SAM-dependent methyltransferase